MYAIRSYYELLGLLLGEVLHQLACRLRMLGMLGHDHAAQVDVGAAILLVGKVDGHRLGGRALLRIGQHDAVVVTVAQRQVADAFLDGLDLVTVVALGLARQVGLDALQPGLGLGLPMVGYHAGHQSNVVLVLAAAGADAALVLGIGQLLVADGIQLAKAILRAVDAAHPSGQCEPAVIWRNNFV